jgi:hypothetical protein
MTPSARITYDVRRSCCPASMKPRSLADVSKGPDPADDGNPPLVVCKFDPPKSDPTGKTPNVFHCNGDCDSRDGCTLQDKKDWVGSTRTARGSSGPRLCGQTVPKP